MPASLLPLPVGLRVEPGGVVEATITVHNGSDTVDRFVPEVAGEPSRWTVFDPPEVALFPGAAGTTTLRFMPPRLPSTAPGPVPFGVRLHSLEQDGDVVDYLEGSIEVAPFYDTAVEVMPRTSYGKLKGKHELAFDNRGNTTVVGMVGAGSQESMLSFGVYPPRLIAPPGTAVFARVKVRPKNKTLRGVPQMHSFHVGVQSQAAANTIPVGDAIEVPGDSGDLGPILPNPDLSLLKQEWQAPPEPKGGRRVDSGYSWDEASTSLTETGRIGEAAFQRLTGGEVLHPQGHAERSPLDVKWQGRAFEVKAVWTDSSRYAPWPKPFHVAQRRAAAEETGLTPAVALVVLDRESKTASVYWRNGLKGGNLSERSGWRYMGQTSLTEPEQTSAGRMAQLEDAPSEATPYTIPVGEPIELAGDLSDLGPIAADLSLLARKWQPPPKPTGRRVTSWDADEYTWGEASTTLSETGRIGAAAFQRLSGGEVLRAAGREVAPRLDVAWGGKAFEVKAVWADSARYAAWPKPYDLQQKRAAAVAMGLTPALALVVLDRESNIASVYWRDGLKGGRLSERSLWRFLGWTPLTGAEQASARRMADLEAAAATPQAAVTADAFLLQEPILPRWLIPLAILLGALAVAWFAFLKPEPLPTAKALSNAQAQATAQAANAKAKAANTQAKAASTQAAAASKAAAAAAKSTATAAAAASQAKAAAKQIAAQSAASSKSTPYSVRLVLDCGPRCKTKLTVTKQQELSVTDVVFGNPMNDAGLLTLARSKEVLFVEDLTTFHDLPLHFGTPLVIDVKNPLVLSVQCKNKPSGNKKAAACKPAAYVTGTMATLPAPAKKKTKKTTAK
jgi:hypothetical protein